MLDAVTTLLGSLLNIASFSSNVLFFFFFPLVRSVLIKPDIKGLEEDATLPLSPL